MADSSPSLNATARIVPEPPQPRGEERLDGWGFTDSGFRVGPDGEVEFTGARYAIGGKKIPSLLPWGVGIFASPLDPRDRNAPHYPTPVPERIPNEPFESALAEKLDPARISSDARQRLRHGHGHTQEDMWGAKWGRFARVPDLVVWPTSDDEVRVVVELARAHRACVIPFGGGTNVTDALRCPFAEKRTIVSLDLRRMNRVLWVDPENRTACIQAGATGSEIEEVLGRHGFTSGHEPDSQELSTLGGWIATAASGMKKNRYGNIEDLVLAITAITPEGGELARAPSARESVGGDPARWLIGSEGRLGVVTSAIVKVFPLPAVRRFGSVLFKSFEEGLAFVHAVERAGCKPASIRLMDNLQFQFGQAVKPPRMGAAALLSRIERAFVLGVRGFDPNQMVACTLLFEGDEREVAGQERGVYALAKRHRGMRAGAENGRRGYELTFAIAYIRDFIMEHWVVAESFETTVPWSRVLDVVNAVKRRVHEEHAARRLPGKPFISVRVTQLYEAGACLYFYFAFYYKGVEHPSEVFAELERAARDEILKMGGSLSHHHGIGKLRSAFLPRVFTPAALAWRERMKQALDPDNVLGCGNG
jgi:alkyldihydroxyacetonephosphate synthase